MTFGSLRPNVTHSGCLDRVGDSDTTQGGRRELESRYVGTLGCRRNPSVMGEGK